MFIKQLGQRALRTLFTRTKLHCNKYCHKSKRPFPAGIEPAIVNVNGPMENSHNVFEMPCLACDNKGFLQVKKDILSAAFCIIFVLVCFSYFFNSFFNILFQFFLHFLVSKHFDIFNYYTRKTDGEENK